MSEETKKCKHCQSDIPKKAKVCPNCRKKQKHTGLGIVLIIIGVIIIIGVFGGNSEDSTTNTSTSSVTTTSNTKIENKAEQTKEEVIEYTACYVEDMMDLLNSNALKAQNEYKGKYLEVTGRLAVIDSSGKYISINPTNNEWAIIGVQCYIKNNEQKAKVLEMNTDDIITVRIKCTDVGEVLGYSADIIEFVE